jgi:hypothetical protein
VLSSCRFLGALFKELDCIGSSEIFTCCIRLKIALSYSRASKTRRAFYRCGGFGHPEVSWSGTVVEVLKYLLDEDIILGYI